MQTASLEVGSVISFLYPRHNYAGCRQTLELRRLQIETMRDMGEKPLDPLTTKLEPNLIRGRILITGLDLTKNAKRSFYLDRMTSLEIHERTGDFVVAEIEPTKSIQIRQIRDFDLSFVAAQALIIAYENQDPHTEYKALPIQMLE